MDNRRKRLTAALLLTALCLTQFTGCSFEKTSKKETSEKEVVEVTPMEPEESRAYGISSIGGKDVLPIGTGMWLSISDISADGNVFPDAITEERFQIYKDAGIKLCPGANLDYATWPDLVMQCMDMAQKFGIGYTVYDSTLISMIESETFDENAVMERLAEYIYHPACCGVFLVDEPNTAYYMPTKGDVFISKYADIMKVLHENDIWSYTPLLPAYNSDVEGIPEKYEQYLNEFCETFYPDIVIYDNYPFDNDGTDLKNYFWNMSMVRDVAANYNLPFGVILQAGGQWNDANVNFDSVEYYPTEGQYRWNASCSLAMGAQYINIFPGLQPNHFAKAKTEKWDFTRNGLLGSVGNKTQWYNYALNVNKHIEVIDEVLMNSVNKGVIITGEQAKEDLSQTRNCVIESGTFQELMSVKGEALVGCFNYQGKTALYVVNYSMEYAQYITLEFNTAHNIKMVQGLETSYVNAETLKLDMAAGEGVLLVIEE